MNILYDGIFINASDERFVQNLCIDIRYGQKLVYNIHKESSRYFILKAFFFFFNNFCLRQQSYEMIIATI
jgi:hypothetical protein